MASNIVIESRVKEFARQVAGEDTRCAGDFVDALNGAVEVIIKQAAERAKANGRKTLQKQDI